MTIYGVTSVFPVAIPTLAQATDPADPLAIPKRHYKIGVSYFDRRQYKKALVEFQKAYDLSDRPNPLLSMALCYKALGQSEKAIAHYRLYLEKAPDSPERQNVEVSIARLENKTQTGVSSATGDVYIPPFTDVSKLEMAKIYFRDGKKFYEKKEYEAALDKFQKSYELIRIIDTQYNIGLCHEKLKAYDKAIAALQLYVQGNPGKEEQEEAETRIAWIRSQMNRQKEGEPAGQAVAAVAPKTKIKEKIRVPKDETWKMPYQESVPIAPAKEAEAIPPPPLPLPLAKDTYLPPPGVTDAPIGITKKSGPVIPYKNLMWTSLGLSAGGLAVGLIGHFGAKSKQGEHANLADDLEREGKLARQPDGNRDFINQQAADTDNNKNRLDSLKSDVDKYGTMELAGFISGAVFLGLGGAFYWLNRRQVRLAATTLANGGAVTLEGGF